MRKHTIMSLAVMVVLVFAAALVPLQAQDIKGSFTLPMEARWGQITLAPGDYTFSMDQQPESPRVLQLRHKGTSMGYVLTETRGDAKSSQSALLLEQCDGMYAVRALRIADVGTFTYDSPKKVERQVAQKSTTAIPVHASGK